MTQLPASPNSTTSLRSVHTTNLPGLFKQLGISLAVSTYQAGKLILVRADSDALNTHFVTFNKPMGIAVEGSRMSVGGASSLWHYRNIKALAPKIDPIGKHDAVFVPSRIHVTGDIDIHEMAWAGDGKLWAVNTKFGCLCTFDADHSFNPRWTPAFLSSLAPEDRCHLNGLAMVNGHAKYVTALGESDVASGWRANKPRGGILMDVETNTVLLRGLSMPHSPRWYRNQLWVLESGEGTLARVDLETKTWQTIAQMPGFTRGIDFYGPLAFIGLSQIRESATFSGIPLAQRLRANERTCGIWIVNIESGETLGFIRFEEGVQEIFAVSVLNNIRFPTLLELDDSHVASAYVLPDEALTRVQLPTEDELREKPAYHAELGVKFASEKKLEEAAAAFRECLRLDIKFPNACYNLGVCLGDLDQYDAAMQWLTRAAEIEPERAEIYNSMGYVSARRGDAHQALTYYAQAVQEQSDYAQAHFNLGMMQLLLGDYKNGWDEYAWRWKTGSFAPFVCPQPRWDGKTALNQILLLHTEQGAGDAIQFARYVRLAVKLVKRVVLVAPPHLLKLFATLEGVAELRLPGEFQIKDFDMWTPLMDLPQLFGTRLENIPPTHELFDLSVLRRRVEQAPVLAKRSARSIGLVWAGSATHANNARRSCTLNQLLPLLKMENCEFFGLQVGEHSADLKALPQGVHVVDLSQQLKDYADTALVLDQLDLVITVDTSVAHLAGALGLPTWVLLPLVPDWRWGTGKQTTPWYPSMRLFRQTEADDWSGPIAKISKALELNDSRL